MIKIITDTSSLYTRQEGLELGIQVTPLCICIDNWNGRDLEMDMDRFYTMIDADMVPISSQPPIGEVVDAYNAYPECEQINITMADGLSGTYQSAYGAKTMIDHPEKISVFNSKTLCGPHRYMIDQALKMAKEHKTKEEILAWLQRTADKTESFLIPQDFGFLRRGGRLTPIAAAVGHLLKFKVILKLTEDGKKLDKFGLKRTITSTAASVIKHLEKLKLDEKHIIYISHANVIGDATKIKEMLANAFPKSEIQLFPLSPAFVTQGGPGCIAIQYVEK